MKKILTMIVALFSVSAMASNVYVQNNVFVAGEGKTVVEAQTNAVSNGQKEAFLMLLKKIAPNVDLNEFSELDVSSFVQDVSLSNEKVTATTYKGDLTVRFKAEPIQELLMEKNISFLSSLPEPMLFIPVYEEDGKVFVFDKENPVLKYFETAKPEFDFFQIKTVSSEVETLDRISKAWNEGLFEKHTSLLNEYEVSRVLVFHIKKTGDVYEVKTKVLPENQATEAHVEFQVMDDRGDLAYVIKDLINDAFLSMKKKWIYLATKNVASVEVYHLLTPITRVSELKKVKDKINQLNFVEKIEIKGFKNKMLEVELSFRGQYDELQQKLLLNQMSLEPYELSDERDLYLLTFIDKNLNPKESQKEDSSLLKEQDDNLFQNNEAHF